MLPTGQLSLNFGPPSSSGPLDRGILRLIRHRLLVLYGPQPIDLRLPPLWQLIGAILSSRTRDAESLAAFRNLLKHCTSLDALSRQRPEDIVVRIRLVQFADRKAEYICNTLRRIKQIVGGFDLMFLKDWPDDLAMRWLMALPGVGPKAAATTLNWSRLRKRVLAVDTHLLRVGERLGLLPAYTDYQRGFEIFMSLVPAEWDADDLFEFHWLLKLHSQQTCLFERPACPRCSLRNLCSGAVTRH